ncbi:MAG TPA: hypothetical protein VF829_00145 [Candidatus Paceibacterota bacterium]
MYTEGFSGFGRKKERSAKQEQRELPPGFIEAVAELRERALEDVRALPSRIVPENLQGIERARMLERAAEPLAYHGVSHTERAVERMERLISVLRRLGYEVSARDEYLGKVSGFYHDSVMDFDEKTIVEPNVGMSKVMMVLHRDKNEQLSAEKALQGMRAMQRKYPGIFTDKDEALVHDAIVAGTFPGFAQGTVYQPVLDRGGESPLATRLLALADIGAAGMDGPDVFRREGDAFFREENLDIADAIETLRNGGTLDAARKAYFISRMRAWSNIQVSFAEGRKAFLEKELAPFPPEVREGLKREVFNQFEASIAAARAQAERRAHMDSFEELAQDMGYDLASHASIAKAA